MCCVNANGNGEQTVLHLPFGLLQIGIGWCPTYDRYQGSKSNCTWAFNHQIGLDFVNLFLGFVKRKKSSARLWRSCTCVLNIAANSCWLVKSCIKSLVMMLATILRLIKPKQKRVVQNLSFKKKRKNSRIMVMWCNFYGHESSYDLNLSEFFKILRIYFFIIFLFIINRIIFNQLKKIKIQHSYSEW